jgi:hypothetical protein
LAEERAREEQSEIRQGLSGRVVGGGVRVGED